MNEQTRKLWQDPLVGALMRRYQSIEKNGAGWRR
jgi:hypothetical protein